MSKRSWIIIIISSAVALITAVTLILVFTLRKPAEEPTNNNTDLLVDSARSIKIVQMEGSGTVTDSEGTTDCFVGLNLYDGDSLKVNDKSVIVVKFDEDKYVYFGENTKVNLKSEGKDSYKTNIFVESGIVLAEIQNKLGVDEEFFLSSNNSVMAVRGTIFGVEVKDRGEDYVATYSVYKGVTELFVFDKTGDSIVKGKLTDISNKKIEIVIPKTHVIPNLDFNKILENWLGDIGNKYSNEEEANSSMDKVEITVGVPTEEDFEKVIGIIEENKPEEEKNPEKTDEPIKYSSIKYTSEGFFGNYDGEAHGVTVTPANPNAKVYYKGEGETEYGETNNYKFYAPGSYRVYYKITLDGAADKEDYEVVVIAKPNITLTSDHIAYDNVSQTSMLSIEGIQSGYFNKYNGVLASEILSNSTYYINGKEIEYKNIDVEYNEITTGYIELVDGKNTLSVKLEFDDYSFTTDVNFYFSDTRDEYGYVVGALDSNLDSLGGNLYFFNINSFIAFEAGKYSMDGNTLLTAFGLDVQDLSTMFINSPYDVYDSKNPMTDYDGTNTFYFEENKFNVLNFVVYPTAEYKGFNETVYMYIGTEAPTNYPSYTLKSLKYVYNPEKTPTGILVDFIQTSDTVTYSLDGSTYNSNLYITEAGNHNVYYKVVNQNATGIEVTGSEVVTVLIGESKIAFDAQKFITNPIHLFSNDNHEFVFGYRDGDGMTYEGNIVIENGTTVTSLDDAYLVYSNMIKNAKFYDSITNEEIEASVVVFGKNANSSNFNYTITADGYDTINGVVRFDYSDIGVVPNNSGSGSISEITITLPVDYTASLSEIATVIPSRTSLSVESGNLINYQTYYSIDEGKTWSTDSPKIKQVGEYSIYTLYCFVDKGNDATDLVDGSINTNARTSLPANGSFIIAVQNITVVA